MDGTIWTEPEDESGNLVQRMNDTVRMMHPIPLTSDEPLVVSRKLYDVLLAQAPTGDLPRCLGMPVVVADDPAPSYRDAIGDALRWKQAR